MNKEMKKTMLLSIVGVLTLITLVAGATYAYFKAQGGEGGSSDVNVITATTDLLTFKIDKAINISISQSELKKGGTDVSDSTGAHATLTASNSKNVEKTTRSYNIYFVIDTNDFEYTTQDGTPELYLNVTDPNGNSLENITGLVHYDKGFDITTRTGGFLLVPDYDIEATRGNTITQDWKVEVTFANLDTDQSKNMGKSLSGKLFVTSDKMNSYELSKITNMTTKTTYNSIDTTLEVEQGSAEVNKYYYGIEKTSSNVTGYVNNNRVKKVALKDVNFVETDKNTYKFDNLSDNSVYKVYSYGVDKNGIKTNLYETEVTTSEYNNPVVNSVSHTSTLNSITLSVNATKGDNDIVKYYYSKDNGATYEESDTNSYVFNNLKDTTEYKIKVKVLDSYGRYSTEFVKAISTETYILPSVTSVTPTTKYNQISVSVVGANGTNNISKYYYSINGGAYTESTNSSYTFTGLNEKTNYSIKVKVVDTLGRESNVYNLSVTTDAYVLPRVTNVSTSSTDSSITINVSASGGTGSVVKYYYSKDNGSNYVESTSNSYTFNNLTSGATFYVKVYVKDSNNRDSSVSATFIRTKILICSSETNLASCLKTYSNKGSSITNIYHHDANLAYGARDNSYRYSGASDAVNNYVCFGSTQSPCPADNLYRIIGVFGDRVKLIKSDYATKALLGRDGDYITMYTANRWDNSNYKGNNLDNIAGYNWNHKNDLGINSGNGSNTWSTSLLNNTNLNQNFITNIGSEWAKKIDKTTWKVGGNTESNIANQLAKTAYQNEIVNPVTTNTTDGATEYSAKIGLMYVSDYGFAAVPSAWTANLSSYDGEAIKNVNWMYMGLAEWTISRRADHAYHVFYVDYTGGVSRCSAGVVLAVRPVFYLTPSVTYAEGDGTQNSPIRIN